MSQPWIFNQSNQTNNAPQMYNPAQLGATQAVPAQSFPTQSAAQSATQSGGDWDETWDSWGGNNEDVRNANPLKQQYSQQVEQQNPQPETKMAADAQAAVLDPNQTYQVSAEQYAAMSTEDQWAYYNYCQQMQQYHQQQLLAGQQEQQQQQPPNQQQQEMGNQQHEPMKVNGENNETSGPEVASYDDGGTVSRFFGGDAENMMEDINLDETTEESKSVASEHHPSNQLDTFNSFGNTHLQPKVDFMIGSGTSSALSSAQHIRPEVANGEPEVSSPTLFSAGHFLPERARTASQSSAGSLEPHPPVVQDHQQRGSRPPSSGSIEHAEPHRGSRPPSSGSRASSSSPGVGPPPMAKAGADNPFRRPTSRSKYVASPLAAVTETNSGSTPNAFPLFQPSQDTQNKAGLYQPGVSPQPESLNQGSTPYSQPDFGPPAACISDANIGSSVPTAPPQDVPAQGDPLMQPDFAAMPVDHRFPPSNDQSFPPVQPQQHVPAHSEEHQFPLHQSLPSHMVLEPQNQYQQQITSQSEAPVFQSQQNIHSQPTPEPQNLFQHTGEQLLTTQQNSYPQSTPEPISQVPPFDVSEPSVPSFFQPQPSEAAPNVFQPSIDIGQGQLHDQHPSQQFGHPQQQQQQTLDLFSNHHDQSSQNQSSNQLPATGPNNQIEPSSVNNFENQASNQIPLFNPTTVPNQASDLSHAQNPSYWEQPKPMEGSMDAQPGHEQLKTHETSHGNHELPQGVPHQTSVNQVAAAVPNAMFNPVQHNVLSESFGFEPHSESTESRTSQPGVAQPRVEMISAQSQEAVPVSHSQPTYGGARPRQPVSSTATASFPYSIAEDASSQAHTSPSLPKLKASSLPPSLRPPPLSELPKITPRASPISHFLPGSHHGSPSKRRSGSSTPEALHLVGQGPSHSTPSHSGTAIGSAQASPLLQQAPQAQEIQRVEPRGEHVARARGGDDLDEALRAAVDDISIEDKHPSVHHHQQQQQQHPQHVQGHHQQLLQGTIPEQQPLHHHPDPIQQQSQHQHLHQQHGLQQQQQQLLQQPQQPIQQQQPPAAQHAVLPPDLQDYDREPPAMPDLVSGTRGFPSLPMPDLPEQALTSMGTRGQPLDVAQPSAQQVPDLTPSRAVANPAATVGLDLAPQNVHGGAVGGVIVGAPDLAGHVAASSHAGGSVPPSHAGVHSTHPPRDVAQPTNLTSQPSQSLASLDEAIPPTSASSPARNPNRPASLEMVQKDHHMNIYSSPLNPHPNSPFQPPRTRKESGGDEVSQITAGQSGREYHGRDHGSPLDSRRHTPGSRRRQVSGGSSGSRNTPPDIHRHIAPLRHAQSDLVAPPTHGTSIAHAHPAASAPPLNLSADQQAVPVASQGAGSVTNQDAALRLSNQNAGLSEASLVDAQSHQAVPNSYIPLATNQDASAIVTSSAHVSNQQQGLSHMSHIPPQNIVPNSQFESSQYSQNYPSQKPNNQPPGTVAEQPSSLPTNHNQVTTSERTNQQPAQPVSTNQSAPELVSRDTTDSGQFKVPEAPFKPRMSEDFVLSESDKKRMRQRDPRYQTKDDDRHGDDDGRRDNEDGRYGDSRSRADDGKGYDSRYDERSRNKDGYYDDRGRYYDRPRSRTDDYYNYRPRSRTDPEPDERSGSRPSSRQGRQDYYADDGRSRSRPSSRTADQDPRSRSYDMYDSASRADYYSQYYGRGDYDRGRHADYDRRRYDYDRYYGYDRDYYDEYYRRRAEYDKAYSKGYYDEMQSYGYGTQQAGEYDMSGYYYDYYTRQWRPYEQYDRTQSRGETPNPEQSGSSRSSSRQSGAYDDYHRSGEGKDDNRQDTSMLDYTDNPSLMVDQTLPDMEESSVKPRLTPVKFSSPHVMARFTSHGQLIKVMPHRPDEGQPAIVEIHNVDAMTNPEYSDVDIHRSFPGPLVSGETHKNDVLSYCRTMARHCRENVKVVDRESAELLWQLLELLIRQNGTLVGTDISDLLLENHEPTSEDYNRECALTGDRTVINRVPPLPMEEVTDRFRHLLLYGRKKDALEWASKHELWGHALFLASKMDGRTHASIMTRFANSAMRMNDPLQTLYQLMSSRQPAAVTCISDHHWGDWRPHAAMILSSRTQDQNDTYSAGSQSGDLVRRSLTTMGDTLAAKGCLYASHFCYLMAQQSFGRYHSKTKCKMVLIGASHSLPFHEFASTEAIQCTEVYEYAKSLANPYYVIHNFQVYKFLYAVQLLNSGLVLEAYHYCEMIARAVCTNPGVYPPVLVQQLAELASRLKTCDPQYHHCQYLQDPQWLSQLRLVLQAYQEGTIVPTSAPPTPVPDSDYSMNGSYHQYQNADPTVHNNQNADYSQSADPSAYAQNTDYGQNADYSQNADYQQTDQEADTEPQNQEGESGVGGDGTAQASDDQAQNAAAPEPYVWDGQQWLVNPEWMKLYYPHLDQSGAATQDPAANHEAPSNHSADDATEETVSNGYEEGDEVDDLATSSSSQQTFDFHGSHGNQQQKSPPPRRLSTTSTIYDPTMPPPTFETPPSQFGSPPSRRASLLSSPPSRRASLISTKSCHSITSSRHNSFSSPSTEGAPRAPSIGRRSRYNSQSSQLSSAPSSPRSTKSQESVIFNYNAARRPPSIQGPPSGPSSPVARVAPPAPPVAPPKAPPQQVKSPQGPGILRGLANRLWKSKNEMILPDDKDPTIVWDADKKRWVNKEGDEDEDVTAAPPPKDSELVGRVSGPASEISALSSPSDTMSSPTGGPPTWNRISKMKKGARSQYVDVLNQSKPATSSSSSSALPANLFNVMPSSAAPPVSGQQFFVPSPTESDGGDQPTIGNPDSPPTTPDDPMRDSNDMDLSRSSSASSLGREVQNFTHVKQREEPPPGPGGMMMFNPSQVQQPKTSQPTRFKLGQRRQYPK